MRRLAKKSLFHSYRFGVLSCELLSIGSFVYEGLPVWPPYALVFMMAIGVVVGVLGIAELRRLDGLPVLPGKSRARPGHITSDSEVQLPDERDDPGEARADS